MSGTIEEYIAAYEDIWDQSSNTINFDEAGQQLNFYNGLCTHIISQFDMSVRIENPFKLNTLLEIDKEEQNCWLLDHLH
ncbi:hypothetical protein DSO57_1008512 [Entomophthora muscae]|uniref:Uncharacterized protein n=1 Tax=Entomophthora muscae TaxID=34485 RepID=A0ACC2THZ1_9FUNG|nr:hypothetical protein DSO57_1008512 [Entomophthora muscae]